MDLTRKGQNKGLDPFENCMTIASAEQTFYNMRASILFPTLVEKNHSVLAYQWLAYMSHKTNINIKHGENYGEKHIGSYKLDSY